MNPKGFLKIGGIVLIVVAILGMVGVLGPSANDSIFGATWWFDGAENWAHLVIGVVALLALYGLGSSAQRTLVKTVGIVALLVGIYNLLGYTSLWGAHLEKHADTVLHLAIGIWALMASKKGM